MQTVLENELQYDEELHWTSEISKSCKEFLQNKSLTKIFLWIEEDGMKFTF